MEATTYYLTFIISAILDDNLSSGILPSIVYALTGTGFFTIVGRFYLTKLHDKLGMDFHDQFGSQLVRIIALTNTLSFGEQTELERSRMVTKIGKIAQELYQESKSSCGQLTRESEFGQHRVKSFAAGSGSLQSIRDEIHVFKYGRGGDE